MTRLVAVLLACSASFAQTYVVSGVVLRPGGGPARRVRVAIAPYQTRDRQQAVVTGETGEFRFEVQAGKYHLTAEPPNGNVLVYGQETFAKGFGTSIVTGPEFHNENLRFPLIPPAVLHGRVTDENGDPVEQARVNLFLSAIVAGRRTVIYGGSRVTDDRGIYRFPPLRDGTYYVAASGKPWYTRSLLPGEPLASAAYPLTYFPGAREPRGAAAMELKPGQEAAADITLSARPAAKLRVLLQGGFSGSATVALRFAGPGGTEGLAENSSATAGKFAEFRGVHPGRYVLRASTSSGKIVYGTLTVDMGSADTEVAIALMDAPEVNGKLTLAGGPIPANTVVGLDDDENNVHYRRPVAADGTFRFEALPPGRYRPFVGTPYRNIPLRSVALDGSLARLDPLDIIHPATLELTASLSGAALRGDVVRNDKPVPGVLALLAPQQPSANPLDYRAFQTDSDGSFEWEAIPPGDYVLIVQENWFDLEYANPEVIRPLAEKGKPIHVEAAGTEKLRIELR